jgi:hypothetical protein
MSRRNLRIGALVLAGFAVLLIGVWVVSVKAVVYINYETPAYPQYRNHSYSELIQQLGPPSEESRITMEETGNESRIALRNWYPYESWGNRLFVTFRELTWRYPGHSLTLWFHRHDGRWVCLWASVESPGVVSSSSHGRSGNFGLAGR